MNLLAELAEQGRPALLVGGTGLYFTALTRGLADIPAVPSSLRSAIEAEYLDDGEARFRARLMEDDPRSAGSIEQGDRQRLIRAMSVLRQSGRSISDWQADTRPLLPTGSWTGRVVDLDRAHLYARCDVRVDAMMDSGAVEEVRGLLERDLDPALPAMKAVGVREIVALLTGRCSRQVAVTALKQATRNYAKRQMTWFRNQTPDWTRDVRSHHMMTPEGRYDKDQSEY